MYDDKYNACLDTYVTIRIFHDSKHPDEVTSILGITPTHIQVEGEWISNTRKVISNGWFLSTNKMTDSKDSRRHIDELIDRILPQKSKIQKFQEEGAKIDICCYWLSRACNGGPTLSKAQLLKLAELELDFWYDFYCDDNLEKILDSVDK